MGLVASQDISLVENRGIGLVEGLDGRWARSQRTPDPGELAPVGNLPGWLKSARPWRKRPQLAESRPWRISAGRKSGFWEGVGQILASHEIARPWRINAGRGISSVSPNLPDRAQGGPGPKLGPGPKARARARARAQSQSPGPKPGPGPKAWARAQARARAQAIEKSTCWGKSLPVGESLPVG